MCGLCAALGGALAWEQEGLDAVHARHHRRREAAAVAAEVSRLLVRSRVTVDANPDFGFIVSFPTGGAEIVASLVGIWHLLRRRGIDIPDPLGHD